MPAPTTSNFFGATATNTGNTLTINRADFTTFNNSSTKPERWLVAILERIRLYTESVSDDDANATVGAPFNGLVVRTQNNVSVNQRSFSYTVVIYQDDPGGTIPDPDNV